MRILVARVQTDPRTDEACRDHDGCHSLEATVSEITALQQDTDSNGFLYPLML